MDKNGWLPIESAPEDQWILTFACRTDPPIAVSKFRIRKDIEEQIVSESTNAKGRRKIIQEIEVKNRDWEGGHWEPTYWQPLPPPPGGPK